MKVTLVALMCRALLAHGGPEICRQEIVTTSQFDHSLTWQSCQIQGQQIVADWMRKTPPYFNGKWYAKKYKCAPGDYVIPNEA